MLSCRDKLPGAVITAFLLLILSGEDYLRRNTQTYKAATSETTAPWYSPPQAPRPLLEAESVFGAMYQIPLEESPFGITFFVEQPQEPFTGGSFHYSDALSADPRIYPGQTFDNSIAFSSDSSPSSAYSSPAIGGLGVSFGDYEANNMSSREVSPTSPQSPPGAYLEPPPARNFTRRKSSSSAEMSISSLRDLRRYPSSPSLGDNYHHQQIMDISQDVRQISLGTGTTSIFEASKPDPTTFMDCTSPSYGGTSSLIPTQTQVPSQSQFWPTPTPSPVSPNSPLLAADGTPWKDRPKRIKSRSKKDKEASLRRRKIQGPGEFVCDVCGDDFTAMHRLQGHKESKHEGVKFRCDACNSDLSHRTSYDRHIKKTCPVRNPRDGGK
ncbi:hypothetical protein IW261DRAFT_1476491 [Armillaria novae-zelandiae]|uniref:C2H2-type domain-containing protein n=1 Tax=Armillaria novae-zelandiae TaxID=153914 RepID=A0AA39UB97_9AGAR|nr:hypothetical protein IW261DRAFT_1476491 [Armillaria novae-zelandiae]